MGTLSVRWRFIGTKYRPLCTAARWNSRCWATLGEETAIASVEAACGNRDSSSAPVAAMLRTSFFPTGVVDQRDALWVVGGDGPERQCGRHSCVPPMELSCADARDVSRAGRTASGT